LWHVLLGAEHDVPAACLLHQPGAGHFPGRGVLADAGQGFGPPEADPADHRDGERAPFRRQARDPQIAGLGHIDRQMWAALLRLERRSFGRVVGVEEVLPRLRIRFENGLGCLGGEHREEIGVFAGLADRRIGLCERWLFSGEMGPVGVQAVPQGDRGSGLFVQGRSLGAGQFQAGFVPALPLDHFLTVHGTDHTPYGIG
jgi:hypothetical protein